MKNIYKGALVTFLIVVLFLSILILIGRIRRNMPDSAENQNDQMTFQVTVPRNTFNGDTVHIYLNTQKSRKMTKTGEYTYDITLTRRQIEPEGDTVRYRYSRNGHDFNTAEYLEPDTNDYFWTKLGRTTKFEPGKLQKDIVERWRWFPKAGVPIINTSDIEPVGEFLPRVDGYEFRSGQIIEDLYNPAYDDFFDSTAIHMKETGYRWVEIDPPWQWTEVDGLPKVENLHRENPNYPTDEKFAEEIRAYKKQGLKVAIQPQICCTTISTENRTAEWWDAYFSETTRFLVHFAKISEAENVDAMHYAIGSWDVAYAEKWTEVFREIRKHFSGQIGEMVWNFGQEPGAIIPSADEIKWADELDYFYIAIDTPISTKDDPTDAELKAGADIMLDGTKVLHERFGKPVVARTTYFNVRYTWKGNSFYTIADVPWCNSEENALITGKYAFDNDDQARVVNAYFQSIAERPWIIGYGQFGYSHWENPLCAELSVRGKPSEDVWKKWNDMIYGEQLSGLEN